MQNRALPRPPPDVVVRMGLWARRAIQRLADAITPAELVILEHASGVMRTQMLGAAVALDLVTRLADGPRSGAEIAAQAGTDPDATHRLLRGLASLGLLRRTRDGRFVGTRLLSGLARQRASASGDLAAYWASGSNVGAWNDFPETLRTGRGAFARVHGMSVWDWFDAHPEERETFARAMGGLTSLIAPIVADSYPWAEVQRVCDVGGGRGMLLSEILLRHRHLHGVLCDAEGVVASAATLLEARGVLDRVDRVAGSFFSEVPGGADAYVLKNILHDWDDAACAQILSVVRRAMRPGDRLVIVELILERDDIAPVPCLSDLHMMVVCDEGRERSRADFARLLQGADFRSGRMWPGALTGIVEGIAV